MDSPALRECLLTLARNHRWTWNPGVASIFEALPGWADDQHPVSVVAAASAAQLDGVRKDPDLVRRVEEAVDELTRLTATAADSPDVAYFSPEFGLSDLVPQYSGGLGILAGDHLKAASDLGAPLCGVGLFYNGGFFRQSLADGRQVEQYEVHDPTRLGCVDTGSEVTVPLADREVVVRVWRLDVGRIPLLLLDTDTEPNRPADRAITDRLYSGDRRHRLEQELILGVGGSRALDALGWTPPVCHLNEGHAGFLILDLLDHRIQTGEDLDTALAAIRPGLVFTTHTPVPAGIDRFEIPLATEYLTPWADRWGVSVSDLLALGAAPDDVPPTFNMAALCLAAAGRANGVSRLHGAVSRELFAGVPGGDRITSVTNGVHARTWVMPRLQETFDEVLGAGWESGDEAAWSRVSAIDDDTVRKLRRSGGHDLAALVAERTEAVLDPDVLTIGFARRFATYKRATLLLQHPDELAELLADTDRPVQFVFAGKAHPADSDGKALIADIIAYAGSASAGGRFVFVPDYDMRVARAMYAGCDVWLNTPVRPHEASGTSGEKSALNGGINCSISDGWWDEMADGRNGWTIPASDSSAEARRDLDESAAALAILRDEVRTEHYDSGDPWSTAWVARIRHNWRSLGPRVTAGRMVAQYRDELYGPALDDTLRP